MPLSGQEKRCMDLACEHLAAMHGGLWRIAEGPTLDQLYPSEPSPEALVGNGSLTAAIEVKRLTGDLLYEEYKASIFSLKRYLTPPCGGYYWLAPPIDFRLPMDQKLRRQVKQEIERVAPTLSGGESGALRVPRRGYIAVSSRSGSPHIHCQHPRARSLLAPLLDRLTGQFFLVDNGLEHSFFSDEGRNEFLDILSDACAAALNGDHSPFTWHEEWQLTKTDEDDEDEETGVWIIAVTEARDFPASVAECVYAILEKGLKKFLGRRWGDLHVLALECSIMAPERLVSPLVGTVEDPELEGIDMILLVDGDSVIQAHPPIATSSKEANQ